MKCCETCGIEIDGRDGENRCAACEEPTVRRLARARARRREREAALRSCGLTKVRGELGGVYWE